jgi:acyl-CoA thioester hydrolase
MMADSGAIEQGVHRFLLRVYYEDTDAAGMVYHANHLRFAERARTEMMRCVGLDHTTLRARFGLTFTVRRCVVDFLAPARLDDRLEVRTSLLRQGGASLELDQRILRDGMPLANLVVRLALLDQAMRVARLPRELIAALAPLREFAPAGCPARPSLRA